MGDVGLRIYPDGRAFEMEAGVGKPVHGTTGFSPASADLVGAASPGYYFSNTLLYKRSVFVTETHFEILHVDMNDPSDEIKVVYTDPPGASGAIHWMELTEDAQLFVVVASLIKMIDTENGVALWGTDLGAYMASAEGWAPVSVSGPTAAVAQGGIIYAVVARKNGVGLAAEYAIVRMYASSGVVIDYEIVSGFQFLPLAGGYVDDNVGTGPVAPIVIDQNNYAWAGVGFHYPTYPYEDCCGLIRFNLNNITDWEYVKLAEMTDDTDIHWTALRFNRANGLVVGLAQRASPFRFLPFRVDTTSKAVSITEPSPQWLSTSKLNVGVEMTGERLFRQTTGGQAATTPDDTNDMVFCIEDRPSATETKVFDVSDESLSDGPDLSTDVAVGVCVGGEDVYLGVDFQAPPQVPGTTLVTHTVKTYDRSTGAVVDTKSKVFPYVWAVGYSFLWRVDQASAVAVRAIPEG